jgi:hypothetical protein
MNSVVLKRMNREASALFSSRNSDAAPRARTRNHRQRHGSVIQDRAWIQRSAHPYAAPRHASPPESPYDPSGTCNESDKGEWGPLRQTSDYTSVLEILQSAGWFRQPYSCDNGIKRRISLIVSFGGSDSDASEYQGFLEKLSQRVTERNSDTSPGGR